MNKIFLNLVMLPSYFWEKMGADVDQLRAILDVRLKMDNRKPLALGRQRSQKKERNNGAWMNMLTSLALGLLYMLPIIYVTDRIFSLTMYFSFLLFMISFSLITDLSNVLFDARDKYIIYPRPVNSKTIVLSRLLHVFIYVLRIVLPMSIPAWIVLGLDDGWQSALLFPIPLLLMVFMALTIVNGCYLLLLNIAKPGRFKELINYFQILFSIFFFISVYILPRLFERGQLNLHSITEYPWLIYTPPYWLAACWSWAGFTSGLWGAGYSSLLAIVVPMACLWILIKYLSPQFTKKIAGIDDEIFVPVVGKIASGSTPFYTRIANTINNTDAGKAGFIIAWLQTARSRSFKMKVYPTFAYMPIYFLFLVLRQGASFSEAWQKLPYNETAYFIFLYMCPFVLMQALNYLTLSDQYKAAWVYYAAPVQYPGSVMSGAFKAMWIKYVLPFFIALSVFIIYVWGAGKITDILLALINITVFALVVMRVSLRYLPFSRTEQAGQSGNRVIKSLLSMTVPGFLGICHYLSRDMMMLKVIFIILSGLFLMVLWDSYAKTSWNKLLKVAVE